MLFHVLVAISFALLISIPSHRYIQCYSLFIYLPFEEHVCYFHFGAITNSAFVNILIRVFCGACVCISAGFISGSSSVSHRVLFELYYISSNSRSKRLQCTLEIPKLITACYRCKIEKRKVQTCQLITQSSQMIHGRTGGTYVFKQHRTLLGTVNIPLGFP